MATARNFQRLQAVVDLPPIVALDLNHFLCLNILLVAVHAIAPRNQMDE
ncbi:MAG: hypothetical protein KME42_23615 [Tildeniella nuda ZEHNDER 1965/U140]|jgi:hypothetical protein|nr:hypothetical protein [Tildeniella nuda ZEHNDER 1965/U140]